MELNICSRRVHDGYATIRTRGRNRPRAVYRSDSEELLKELNGPYALSEMSSTGSSGLNPEGKYPRVPRWFEDPLGEESFCENYGTLKKRQVKNCSPIDSSKGKINDDKLPILKTFTNNKVKPRRKSSGSLNCSKINVKKFENREPKIEITENGEGEISSRNRKEEEEEEDEDDFGITNNERISSSGVENSKKEEKIRQPIYAIPNVPKLNNNKEIIVPIRDEGIVDKGNYVPSGDLYLSTAKYIEDLNKNISKIDNSYGESSKCSFKNRNSTYGIINKINKNEIEDCSNNIYGSSSSNRKRDMAPMPPISGNFFEEVNNDIKVSNEILMIPRRKLKTCRPNSYGKLPPKILPRSSSIESSSSPSRNSNVSSSSSSAKSTESLYAISEAFSHGIGNKNCRVTFKEPNASLSGPIFRKAYHTLPTKRSSFKNREEKIVKSVTEFDDNKKEEEEVVDDVFLEENSNRKETCDKKLSKVYRRHSVRSHEDILTDTLNVESNFGGTLPSRKTRYSAIRQLHCKSSDDVIDFVKDTENLRRGCRSTVDLGVVRSQLPVLPVCLLDATDVIMNGQIQRSMELLDLESGTSNVEYGDDNLIDTVDHYAKLKSEFRGEIVEQKTESRNNFSYGNTRTRHNSLEFNDRQTDDYTISSGNINYATLPRRRVNANDKSDNNESCNDYPKRLSGNLPVLEPLYEHAVSDPVKPRNQDNVIPWWELATRKYRHRSCPSLQAHVVSAFEQSLSNMTQRLQHLTATAEKKDSELQELRDTIERLRKQSAEAGLNATSAQNASSNGRRHTLGDSESTTGCTGSNSNSNNNHQGSSIARQLSADSVTSLNSLSSACSASSNQKKKGWLRSSFSKAFSRSRKNRHGSVSDAEDCKEGGGGGGGGGTAPGELISAPNSPRLPTAAKHETRNQINNHQGTGIIRSNNGQRSPDNDNGISGSKSSSALYKTNDDEDVDELKKQLREKDMVLTDIRLEALSSAHQLESLKDTVIKMRNEMLNLKQNNERLQRLVTSKSLTSSQSSLPSDPERRFSMTEVASSVAAMSSGGGVVNAQCSDQLEEMTVLEHSVVKSSTPSSTTATNDPPMDQDTDGKRINVAVYLGSERSFNSNNVTRSTSSSSSSSEGNSEPPHCVIASVCISNKTSWDSLDATVRRCFKDYVARVDPVTNLGLGIECLAGYHLGESSRSTSDSQIPELLPCGYLVGHVRTMYLVLSGYSWLAVDTLIPRSIVQRLVSLLTEHRRVILCGPSGTGKSYLAGKLANALVDADNDTKDAASVATFNVDHKSSKELRQYLAHIAERCDSSAADELPRVIILENLQHAASLGELFSGLLGTRHSSCPAIIGTMSQATCSTTNLQLHHNFRWVLCANHMEPVKGFLGRYLRRRLLEHELRESGGSRNAEMAAVVEWIPRVWLHLNKFLETHSSSDVTIGPRLFLSCPMEVSGSQVWFTDVWNYSVVPYLVDAVREGLTLYGRRISGNGNGDSQWEDPAHFITSSYPWVATQAVHGGSDALRRMRPEDVGYDVVNSGHNSGVGTSSVKSLGSTHSDTEGDPLLNMLMRLQEAANYSSPHSNDSDSVTSLDSSHTRHSEDLTCSSSTSSSRGVESTL